MASHATNVLHSDEQLSPNAEDSSSTTRLTPADSDSESDLELGDDEMAESYKLQQMGEKDVAHAEDDEEEEDGLKSAKRKATWWTNDEERMVVRKFDRKLVLFVALLYMLSFLDRSNIGNARIAGLEVDLELSSEKYEWLLTSFYIAYIAFEWTSILWKIIPAHIYITFIVSSWGLIASLQSIAISFPMLLILRIMLGLGEACFTGIPFYLSFFFKREELALRTGFFISAAPLATSFASALAWGIIYLGKLSPIAPWRLLFLLEGFPSVLVAVIAYHAIPDSPATAHYLTSREKRIAVQRLHRPTHQPSSKLNTREILSVLIDPKAYLTAFMFFFANMAFASLPVFLPTIIREMGHEAASAQALSAPPYLLSFLFVLLTAWLSDRAQSRSVFIMLLATLSLLGYTSLALSSYSSLFARPWIRYAALFPAAVGFFSVVTLTIAWTINNQRTESGQGAGFAIMQIVGQLGPLVGTRLYPEQEGPYYARGMAACAIAMGCVVLLGGGLRLWLGRENQRLEREERGNEEDGEDGAGEGLVGDGRQRKGRRKGESFRYML